MNQDDTKPKVVMNDEHLEAVQAEIDSTRANLVDTHLDNEEKARQMVIESVVKQLEEAKVPFALWASPMIKGHWFVRFQRLDYTEESLIGRAQASGKVLFWRLMPVIMSWIVGSYNGAVLSVWDKERKWLFGVDVTKNPAQIMLPEQEEAK